MPKPIKPLSSTFVAPSIDAPKPSKVAKKTKKPASAAPSEAATAAGKKGAAFLGAKTQSAPKTTAGATTGASATQVLASQLKASQNASAPAPGELAAAQKTQDKTVTEVFVTPKSRTSTTVRFVMPDYAGKEIKPGERWLFEIPADLRSANIRTVILGHRKDAKYTSSLQGSYDTEGAYILTTARNAKTGKWVTWSDQYGSRKFAEPRSAGDPENENLHDWLKAVGPVPVDLVAVTNVGTGKNAIANVHFVEIEFFPPGQVVDQIEKIFTPGTRFVSPQEGIIQPRYGGGMGAQLSQAVLQSQGLYPNAVQLGSWGTGDVVIDENISIKGGRMHIKLPAGKKLGGLEVAIGDTMFDKTRPVSEQTNKDGHYGALGWAKLSARLTNTSGASGSAYSKPFMERLNVPPSGVLSGGPLEGGYVTQPGDEIVIDVSSNAWVMGVRVQFVD